MPTQNSYPDFLRAAALVGVTAQDYGKKEALENSVAQNEQAYRIVRAALVRTCMVPIEASPQWHSKHHGPEIASLKRLTHAMIDVAKLAELEGHTEAAFESYMEAYRFADAIGRGGLSLDFLNSLACRALVLRHSQSVIAALTPEQRAEFLRLIRQSAAEQESPATVVKRTREWQRATFGLGVRLNRCGSILREAWQSRSFTPLTPEESLLAASKVHYEQQYENVVCGSLRAADLRNEALTEPGGPANGSQPIRQETNRTSPAAGSRR